MGTNSTDARPHPSLPSRVARFLGCAAIALAMIVVGQLLGTFAVVFCAIAWGNATGTTLFEPAGEGLLFYQAEGHEAFFAGADYLVFIGIWVVCLAFMAIQRSSRPLLRGVGPRAKGNTVGSLAAGTALGAVLNAACVAVAWASGSVGFEAAAATAPALLALFLCVFVQSGAEELVCRGYLMRKAEGYFGTAAAVVLSSLLFAAMHLMNPGVTVLSVVNIFLVGVLFALLVLRFDSLWVAMAAHAGWNFVQAMIFGLPNSGNPAAYSLLAPTGASTSLVYDAMFGVEGSLPATVVLAAACVVILATWNRRKSEGEGASATHMRQA